VDFSRRRGRRTTHVAAIRRTYRLNDSVKLSDRELDALGRLVRGKLFKPHHLEEGEVVTRFP